MPKRDAGRSHAAQMARRFMEYADTDLAAAEYLLASPYQFPIVQLAFGAAEKALKAAHYHVRAEEPAHTHDLRAIFARVVDRAGPAPDVAGSVALLDPMLSRVRYPVNALASPEPANTITADDARAAVAACQDVMAWVRGLLQQPPRVRRTTSS
jgi:HEPN domain-containing protein